MKRRNKIIISATLICMLCFGVGYMLGYSSAIDLCVKLAFKFTDISTIKINSNVLNDILLRYIKWEVI